MTTESNKDRNFRGQAPNEHVLAFCRRHWTAVLPQMAMYALLLALTIVFVVNYEFMQNVFSVGLYQMLLLFVGALMIYNVHHFFLRLIEHYLSVVIITDLRVISINKSIFFVNEREHVDLVNIQDVHKSQSGFMQNLLNFGDLHIKLAMSSAGLSLPHIPNPDYHLRLIGKARQAYLEMINGVVSEENVEQKQKT